MTKLLDKAIAEVRELPEREQDLAAESLRVFTKFAKQGLYRLSPEERAAIEESKEQVRPRRVRNRRRGGGRVCPLSGMKVRYSKRAVVDLITHYGRRLYSAIQPECG